MRRQDEYKDCTIDVWTTQQGRLFGWAYKIDGSIHAEGKGRGLPDEALALNEGLDDARRKIDGFRQLEQRGS